MNERLIPDNETTAKQEPLLEGESTTPHRRRRLAQKMDPAIVAECFEFGWRNYLEARRNQGLGDPSVMRVSPEYFTVKYSS